MKPWIQFRISLTFPIVKLICGFEGILFLSGFLLDFNIASFSVTLKMCSLFAVDPTPSEIYRCKDAFGVYSSSLPCDFDGGTEACSVCSAQMEYFEEGDCFLCPNMCICYNCDEYVHFDSHDCPLSGTKEEQEEFDGGFGLFGGKSDGKTGTPQPTVSPNRRITVDINTLKKALSDAFDKINEKYPKGAHCNQGVQEAFYNVFGYRGLDNMTANQMLKYMRSSSSWIEVPRTEVNQMAKSGRFIVGGITCPCPGYEKSTHGHVFAVVPGYDGTEISDIHIMDTGIPDIRSKDKQANRSFRHKAFDSVEFYMYNGE